MSLLYKVLFAWKCKGTHHKLALDALRQLRRPDAVDWTNLCLWHIDPYLQGSKDPDDKFKDFRNHVLHVQENFWGGAIIAAQSWYQKLVQALNHQKWSTAAYCAGVLSHYVTDPVQPFHTGQSEEEGAIHRAAEWSISQSYDDLQMLLETKLGGYPQLELPSGDDWLGKVMRKNAQTANVHYQPLIDHYNFAQGVKDPKSGLDQEFKDRIAPLIGLAAVTFARVFERAIEEAGVAAPKTDITLPGILAQLTIPIFWVTRKIADERERLVVERMHDEYRTEGRVLATLPEDDRLIREMHATEVLKVPLESLNKTQPATAGAKFVHGERTKERPAKTLKPAKFEAPHETPRTQEPPARPSEAPAKPLGSAPDFKLNRSEPADKLPPPGVFAMNRRVDEKKPEPTAAQVGRKFHLDLSMPAEQGPSIGSKTAERLAKIGVKTVGQFLEQDPDELSRRLAAKHLDGVTLRSWQSQTKLAVRIPGLRGHDAQMLVAAGVREPEQLARAKSDDLLSKVTSFLKTPDGQRVLRNGTPPDLEEVNEWIAAAKQARQLRAA